MQRVRVRCVLTGACMPVYSGRVFQVTIPLHQADGSATTIEAMKLQICSNWPADMSELANIVGEARIRVLKAGRVLNDSDILEKCLTAAERETCIVPAVEMVEERKNSLEKLSVLVHLVLQRNRTRPTEASKKDKNKSIDTPEGGHSGDGHEAKKDSCCCLM